jgi:hypothetical protein
LKVRIARHPERSPPFKRHPQRTWGGNLRRMFPHQADLRGGKPIPFEIMCQRADGTRAGGSDGHEEHGIHLILRQQACQFMGGGFHIAGISRTHQGGVKRRDTANDTITRHLVQPIAREDDIPGLLKAGAIKIRRDMTHHQVIGRNIMWDDAVVAGNSPGVAGGDGKGTIITAVQASGRDARDPPLAQGWACDLGMTVERRALHRQQ